MMIYPPIYMVDAVEAYFFEMDLFCHLDSYINQLILLVVYLRP